MSICSVQNPDEYAYETKDVLRVLASLSVMTPESVTQIMSRSLFTNPEMIHDTVRVWFRMVQRFCIPVSIGQLIGFISVAPPCLCIEDRIVSGVERRIITVLPFGKQTPLAASLKIPLASTDVRFIKAVQLLLSHYAFPTHTQDQVSGMWTYSNFRYIKIMQSVLDEHRPLFIASALRAVAIELRLAVAKYGRWAIHNEFRRKSSSTSSSETRPASSSPLLTGSRLFFNSIKIGVVPRARIDQLILQQPLSYGRALEEDIHIEAIRTQLATYFRRQRNRKSAINTKKVTEKITLELLNDVFLFVFREKMGYSECSQSVQIKHPYCLIPTVEEVYQFAGETQSEWNKRLKQINQHVIC